ncbi:MAG: UDP-N-acetylmuramate dehydrogenase [Terracidiphilus sp.]
MLLEEYKSLAPFTTLGIGGPARWFVTATSEAEIAEAAEWARKNGAPLFVLGGGSNLLVADKGFRGLVLRVRICGVDPRPEGGTVLYRVGAGEEWDHLVQKTVEENCAGIECLAGIPGSVGGTPVQNVGAYGQEVETTIERVRALDLETLNFVELAGAECGFAYRSSRFNAADRGRFIVTQVCYRLIKGGAPLLRYADIRKVFPAHEKPTLLEVAGAVRQIRRAKGMLLVEGESDCRSAGSFFKNPVVSEECVKRVIDAAGKEPPQFPVAAAGLVKLPAGWLIEQAGFARGFARGPAGISSRHTLALINRGGASAADILALACEIQIAVNERFGIHLEIEPVLLGCIDL